MTQNEGRHEIEAAKKRLAASKLRTAAATQNLQTANKTLSSNKIMLSFAKRNVEDSTKNRDVAQTELTHSHKEEEEAAKCLLEAEKRWEVIDVDADSPEKKKRRKVSVSPDTTTETADDDQTVGVATTTARSAASTRANSASIEKGQVVTKVEVVECGTLEVNGTYTRAVQSRTGQPQLHEGSPIYKKRGIWNGRAEDFVIYRHNSAWTIGVSGKAILFYMTAAGQSALAPPRNSSDWTVKDKGVLPPPRMYRTFAA